MRRLHGSRRRPAGAILRRAALVGCGRNVTTIEGLGAGALQRLFLEEQAAQCGFCTNGIILSLAALLQRDPPASRAEIIAHLDERHLCRCGAQPRILRVVDRALTERVA